MIPIVGNLATDDLTTNVHVQATNANPLTYYDLSWEIGRDFFVSKYLAFNPYVGVRGTWFYETRNVSYIQSTGAGVNIQDVNNFSGVGPMAGVNAKLYFGRHFSLFGNAGTSLIWGRFKVSSSSTSITTGVVANDVNANKDGIVPTMDLAIGFGYDTNFMDDKFNLGIRLGYESHYFFREDQMLQWRGADSTNTTNAYPTVARANSDKQFQGFNLSMIFSF